jgi:hypothetical protein
MCQYRLSGTKRSGLVVEKTDHCNSCKLQMGLAKTERSVRNMSEDSSERNVSWMREEKWAQSEYRVWS